MDSQTPTPAPAPLAPMKTWPGAFGVYKYSGAAVKVVLKTVVLLFILELVISTLVNATLGAPRVSGVTGRTVGVHHQFGTIALGELLDLIAASMIGIATVYTLLSGVKGKTVEIGEALTMALGLIVKYILLEFLVALSLVVSLILFVVPFFFVYPRLVLAPYFLIDQKLGVVEAYKASWHATKGHSSKVWGITGVGLLMILPSITIIGLLLTIYWLVLYSAAVALLYTFTKAGALATPAV
jgi:hypothetical protein